MSCKMVDALVDKHTEPGTWYSLTSSTKIEPGPNTHPSMSDHLICVIAREHKLKDVPEKMQLPKDQEKLKQLLKEIKQRCDAITEAKKSRR